jgi:type IV pilus assembly protein PilW
MIFKRNRILPIQKFITILVGRPAGFTLVEILVGLGLASVVMVVVVGIFTTMGRSFTTQNVAADAQQLTRAGVELMIQEIRMAGLDPSGNANATIVNDFDVASGFHEDHDGKIEPVDATHFSFTMDEDMDGIIDHCRSTGDLSGCTEVHDNIHNELIAFRLNNGTLQRYRGDSATWEDLTENNVSSLNFTYYDASGEALKVDEATGALLDSVDAIRTVEISMTVQLPAGRGGTLSRTYSTRVICRNIGL